MMMQWLPASPGVGMPQSPYHLSPERELALMAQYYDVPVLSLRAAAYHLMFSGQPGYRVDVNVLFGNMTRRTDIPESELFYLDGLHPTLHGSRCLADLIVARIKAAVEERQLAGGSVPAVTALPPPMLSNNYQMESNQCFLPYTSKSEFKQLGEPVNGSSVAKIMAQAARNSSTDSSVTGEFVWAAQQPNGTTVTKQKWAWTASKPGAALVVSVRTDVMPPSNANDPVQLLLFTIQAPAGMGQAQVKCLSGCWCKTTVVDGHSATAQRSVAVPTSIQATQHSECRFSISVRRATTSGGHMVAVAGLAVAHQDAVRLLTVPGSLGLYEEGDSTWRPFH